MSYRRGVMLKASINSLFQKLVYMLPGPALCCQSSLTVHSTHKQCITKPNEQYNSALEAA